MNSVHGLQLALFGGKGAPFDGLINIRRNPNAAFIELTDRPLRLRQTALARFVYQLKRTDGILWHAITAVIGQSEIEAGERVALVRRLLP